MSSGSIGHVVNKYHRLPYDVDIGRGTKWGNPFSHLESSLALFKCKTREEAIERHCNWIFTKRDLLADLKELKGKKVGCYCYPKECHGNILTQLANTTWFKDGQLILECSTKGDIRFSAFGAEIELFGKTATIEEHYQLSKRFLGENNKEFIPRSLWDVKGKHSKIKDMELAWIVVNGDYFPPEFRLEFYKMMWIKFLDENPDLVEYLKKFDDFNDIFKGKSIICQADCIRQYVKQGRESMVEDCKVFTEMLEVKI